MNKGRLAMQKDVMPLAQIRRLKTLCEDCGRRTVWDSNRLTRERLRRRFNSLEELGSRLVCDMCVERGLSARNVSISVDLFEARPGQHVDKRLLAEISCVVAACCDCGHRNTIDKPILDSLFASGEATTVEALWRQAFCKPCRDEGSTEPNVTLETDPPLPSQGNPVDAPVKWSRAEVFGENRSDPFPTLRRSSFFVEEGSTP